MNHGGYYMWLASSQPSLLRHRTNHCHCLTPPGAPWGVQGFAAQWRLHCGVPRSALLSPHLPATTSDELSELTSWSKCFSMFLLVSKSEILWKKLSALPLKPKEFGWNVKTYTVQKPMMGTTPSALNQWLDSKEKMEIQLVGVHWSMGVLRCWSSVGVSGDWSVGIPHPPGRHFTTVLNKRCGWPWHVPPGTTPSRFFRWDYHVLGSNGRAT